MLNKLLLVAASTLSHCILCNASEAKFLPLYTMLDTDTVPIVKAYTDVQTLSNEFPGCQTPKVTVACLSHACFFTPQLTAPSFSAW